MVGMPKTAKRPKVPTVDEAPTIPLWPDAAEVLGVRRSVVYQLASSGRFPVRVFKVGGQWRVPTAELRKLLGLDPEAVA